eukprot:1863643-Rhodomonas_salina.1
MPEAKTTRDHTRTHADRQHVTDLERLSRDELVEPLVLDRHHPQLLACQEQSRLRRRQGGSRARQKCERGKDEDSGGG